MDTAAGFAPTVSFDAVSTQAWARLLKACAVSFLLHIVLLVGLPVNPTGGVPQMVTTITARLEPAAQEPAPESAALVPDPALAPAPIADHPPQPAAPKPATKPEPPRAKEPPAAPSAGIDVPFIRDPTYYSQKELDVYPAPLREPEKSCPAAAVAQRINGRVRLLLLIDEFGVVNDASIVDAQPAGYFEEGTLAAFRAVRFTPAQRQGRAVKCRIQLAVAYICNPTEATAR